METEMNQALMDMTDFTFKRMVDNLVDRRLISKTKDNTFAMHPLIKNYFESIFDEDDKKLCHKRIYQYIGEYAPEWPGTLEEMQPLFEQVYHGCAAGLYDEVDSNILEKKIDRGNEIYLVSVLGAWETELSLERAFFPKGDFSQMPLVSTRRDQGWHLNEAGVALLATGRPKEAEELLVRKTNMQVEDKDWENAFAGYHNLADLQFRTGEPVSGLNSAKKAIDASEKAEDDYGIWISKAEVGWIFYLLGESKEAEKTFNQADEICIEYENNRLRNMPGVQYADFLRAIERIDEALELTRNNLEICKRDNAVNEISRCHRCLGAIERIKKNYKEAGEHLKESLDIARKFGMVELEIEALLESSRLNLDLGKRDGAIRCSNDVLKLCDRTGFKFYEPEAEIVLAKAYLVEKDFEEAKTYAQSAYEKAIGMKYRWAEGEAAHLLGEIYLVRGDKVRAREQLKKAIICRKKILDPKVKESEKMLNELMSI